MRNLLLAGIMLVSLREPCSAQVTPSNNGGRMTAKDTSVAQGPAAQPLARLHWITPVMHSEKFCKGKNGLTGQDWCMKSGTTSWYIKPPQNTDDPCSSVFEDDVVELLSKNGTTVRVLGAEHDLCMNNYKLCTGSVSPIMRSRRVPTAQAHDACVVTYGFARNGIEGVGQVEVSMFTEEQGEVRVIDEVHP